jgi:hypothetical protein
MKDNQWTEQCMLNWTLFYIEQAFFCLIIGYNLLCLAYQAGFTASDQMDLLIEQIKMLAGEVAFGTSSLKRLIEQSIDDPEGTKDQVFPSLFIIFFCFYLFIINLVPFEDVAVISGTVYVTSGKKLIAAQIAKHVKLGKLEAASRHKA